MSTKEPRSSNVQDRTGTRYEKLLAYSLDALGYKRNTEAERNYQHPSKKEEIIISGSYVQPDIVVRSGETVSHIIYSTHWSETRSSKKKFWRTWEEQAQQRVVLGNEFVAVNCVFEALPPDSCPTICTSVDDLPVDGTRPGCQPIQIEGWDAGIGWALVESFDITILFPKGYGPIKQISGFAVGYHDAETTKLLQQALSAHPKAYFNTQWEIIRKVKSGAPCVPRGIPDIATRYRIGLLQLYLLVRIVELKSEKSLPIPKLVKALIKIASSEIELSVLHKREPFDVFSKDELSDIIDCLTGVYVRKGEKPETFCTIRTFSCGKGKHKKELKKITFNSDFKICIADLESRVTDSIFCKAITSAFARFDRAFGVAETIRDIANPVHVENKVAFVETHLLPHVHDSKCLGDALYKLSNTTDSERIKISADVQNWHFEILLCLCGLNSSEDIQTRFKERFEESGHRLRPHAPYGDHAKVVAFLLQGRDVCERWSEKGKKRSLGHDEFRILTLQTVARCVADALKARGNQHKGIAAAEAAILYLQNKSMRIISSDLNGFYIMIDHYLGDICHLQFLDDEEQDECAADALSARVCPSWQTDMVKAIWGSSPLETWVEGVSKGGKWLIKVQSSQDGHEADKTKEVAGRCRAMHLAWNPGSNPRERSDWSFSRRAMPKAALVLDGDWDRTQRKNLYEAGWDWVGEVSALDELRSLIKGKNSR